MGHYDADLEITVRSRSAIQGNSNFINKIEAEDLIMDMSLFKTGSDCKTLYKPNY